MASKTPIKVVTNLDLSRNDILNVSKIEGNQKYENLSRDLEIVSANIEGASSGDIKIYTGTGSTRGSVKVLSGKNSTKGVEVKPDSTINTTSDTNINLTATQGINNTVGGTALKLSQDTIKAETKNTSVTNTGNLTVKTTDTTTISSGNLNLTAAAGKGDKTIVINTTDSKSVVQSSRVVAKSTVETPEVIVNDNLIIYWDSVSNSIVFAKKA